MITQEQLKEVLDYNPDTGVFTWKENKKFSTNKLGKVAGSDDCGYICITIDSIKYKASRLACLYMNGEMPNGRNVVHINKIRNDDRWCNLQIEPLLKLRTLITQDELKERLHYDPETGIFTDLKNKNRELNTIQSRGYIGITILKKQYLAHRLAYLYMTGKWPDCQIDHVNQIKDDNRWSNLRAASISQNMHNVKIRSDNSSGYKGVWRCYYNNKKWRASIKYNGKKINLGTYNTPEEASEVYKKKAIELMGEFAYTGDNTINIIKKNS